jgi:hypothetical protein
MMWATAAYETRYWMTNVRTFVRRSVLSVPCLIGSGVISRNLDRCWPGVKFAWKVNSTSLNRPSNHLMTHSPWRSLPLKKHIPGLLNWGI